MKKQILLLATLFAAGILLPFNVLAQAYEDVVHLKNDSVIRGIIIEQVPNESLKIETSDGSVFVYQMGEVEKMTKEMPVSRSSRVDLTSARQSKFNKPKGYMGLVEVGYGSGFGTDRIYATMVNGYRFFPQLAVGFGTGAEIIGYFELTLPVFLHLRSDFLDGKVSPYFAVNTGYIVSFSDGLTGGFLLDPSAGVSFNVGSKNRMSIGVGYSSHNVKFYYHVGNGNYNRDYGFDALNLKVGFSF